MSIINVNNIPLSLSLVVFFSFDLSKWNECSRHKQTCTMWISDALSTIICSSRRIIKRPSFILYLLLHNVHVRLVHLIFVLCNHGMDKTSGSIYMYLDDMQDITSMLKHSNNVKPHVLIYFIFMQRPK